MNKRDRLLRDLGPNMAESIAGCPGQPGGVAPGNTDRRYEGRTRDAAGFRLALDRVGPDPGQPRKTFDADELTSLAASLRTFGQLQPCVVRWAGEAYVIVAGERRYRAARLAGLAELRCVEWEPTAGEADPEAQRKEVQIVENVMRADLPPLEKAEGYRDLMARRGWSGRELAARLSIDPASVARALALLGLDPATRSLVAAGAIPPATGYELAKVPDEGERQKLAERAAAEKLPRATVAELAAVARGNARPKGGRCPVQRPTAYTSPAGWAVTVAAPPGATPAAVAAELRALAGSLAKGGRRAA